MKIRNLLLLAALLTAVRAQGQETVTVMTYNIRTATKDDGTNSWLFRYPASAMMIDDQQPDVFGLQEATLEQKNYLADYTRGYKGFGIGRDNGKKKGEMTALFYRKKRLSLLKKGTLWLNEDGRKLEKGWDAKYPRTATWGLFRVKGDGHKFFVVNTHLDHKGAVAREKSLEYILSRIDAINPDGYPLVLMGDFNVAPDDAALRVLDGRMRDARTAAGRTDPGETFHGWGHSHKIIDYIWFQGFAGCPLYEVVRKEYDARKFISDHYPVRAMLVF